MLSRAILLGLLAAVEARFGQEQGNGAIEAISALGQFGEPGQAATLGGESIQFLLGAANPCGKLTQADKIVSALGNDPAVIAAARGFAAAEQNFNPSAVSVPSICSDPTLPATEELRGVLPLIDPDVTGSDLENENSATSVTTPFAADGLSVADVMAAQGFTNFTAVAADGTKSNANTGAGAGGDAGSNAGSQTGAGKVPVNASEVAAASATQCGGTTLTTVTVPASDIASDTAPTATADAAASSEPAIGGNTGADTGAADASTSPAAGSGAVDDPITGTFTGFQASTIAGLDFGTCVPTMKFELALNNRRADEGTFQAQDPLINKGQQEALNFNIITKRIQDQLTNVCSANQAAKDATMQAAADLADKPRDGTTADAWNAALGFAGVNINPDNAPKAGLVGHV